MTTTSPRTGVPLARTLIRAAVLLGASAAIWILTAVPARALDGSSVSGEPGATVEDALVTATETVEDASGPAVDVSHAVVAATARVRASVSSGRAVEPATRVVGVVTSLVRTTVARMGAAPAPNPDVRRDDLPGPTNRQRFFDDEGGIVRRDLPRPAIHAMAAPVGRPVAHVTAPRMSGTRDPSGGTRDDRPSPIGGPEIAACPAVGAASTSSAGLDDLAGALALSTILLGPGRWSRHDAEDRITPVFLSMSERPG